MKTTIVLRNGKYIGIVDGKEIVKTKSKYYAQRCIDEMLSMVGATSDEVNEATSEFTIDERFNFVTNVVGMVAKKKTPSCIITGEGGLGKSWTVYKALENAGLKDMTDVISEAGIGSVVTSEKTFTVIKGYSTAKSLYRILYQNRNSTVVFDDCDSIQKDDNAINILKGALDSFNRRTIAWSSERLDDDLPQMFNFKGGVVFISNMSQNRMDQALKTRSMCIDLSMSIDQKIERMQTIMNSPEFLPEISLQFKKDALELIRSCKEKCTDLSLRTLISTTKIRANGGDWQKLAKYMLTEASK